MEASFVDFRKKSSEIIRAIRRNETVTVLYRGRPVALMRPIALDEEGAASGADPADLPAFGMWADREDTKDVSGYVRRLRRGRFDAS